MSDLISTKTTARYGLFMAGGFGGAIVLLILRTLPSFFGVIAGVLVLLLGIGILFSKKTRNTISGIICIAAGTLTILSQLSPFKWLLVPGVAALFVLGIWNGIKFVLSIKSRS